MNLQRIRWGLNAPSSLHTKVTTQSHRRKKLVFRYLAGCIVLLFISQIWYWTETTYPDIAYPSPTNQIPKNMAESNRDHLRYQSKSLPETRVLPTSTWTCTLEGDQSEDAEKSRQCIIHHVCVDDQGLFLLDHRDRDAHHIQNQLPTSFPDINLISSRPSAEHYWKPRFKSFAGETKEIYYKQETLFVYGLFQPAHFSHYLYDGLLPLYSTMKRFQGTESSWLLRQAEYLGENLVKQAVWDMDAILPYGRELVLKDFEVVSQFQALPPKDIPICFDRAVIGLGSQCGLSYCAKNTPTEIYQSYKEQIRNFYWNTTMRWNEFQERRAQEEVSSVSNFSPLKCLKTARYYGFEDEEDLKERKDFSPSLSSHEEPFIRRGERDPDSIDLLSNGKRRSNPIVALIERRTNRAVLNLDHVISTIVKSGHFRLKVLNYDLGCGIPETAYLMRDVNILISPHGNALGGSLWMASPPDNDINPFPTVISIDSTKYYESWFQWTTTAMAQRFILHRCGPAVSYLSDPKEGVCPLYRNLDLARKIINELGLTLDKSTQEEDLLALTGTEFPIELLQRYSDINRKNGDTSEEWAIKMSTFLSSYWKKIARYADPDRLLQTLERIRNENAEDRIDTRVGQSKSKLSYLQLCMQGRCCGPECEGVMNRNVVGALRAYDQDISEGNWGEFLPNEDHSRFMRSGERLKSWIE